MTSYLYFIQELKGWIFPHLKTIASILLIISGRYKHLTISDTVFEDRKTGDIFLKEL
jgi:hypothetical protein